ncbi:MAG: R3H domain-containing nucleic acid-binding protein [Dehalococcoidales bacterium]|nr:R3H domain-containing nucleic acid-binding protein [Dehalococcoidales bacterium]
MEMPEEHGQVMDAAREVLEKLLGLMDMPATVAPSTLFSIGGEEESLASLTLDIKGDDLGILIGRRGQTLASLQYLVRLIVSQKTQTKLPIIIDIEGYKRHRWESLRSLALRMADQVKQRRIPFTLEPMPAFERRIIHLALADNPDVTTESTGEGEARQVVILPRKSFNT